jgi:D-alanyl-D-alanine carboxypeptidase
VTDSASTKELTSIKSDGDTVIPASDVVSVISDPGQEKLRSVFSQLPSAVLDAIPNGDPAEFLADLAAVLAADTEGLLVLVDKQHALSSDYIPEDLVPLVLNSEYEIWKDTLSLRRSTEVALRHMAAEARKDGITLIVSSSYRSYEHQKTVYERNVLEMGKEAADRESAAPGTSQHQTGTAIDFGSITDDFAQTPAGKWLDRNAGTYGFSLSFPDGYEQATGYRWECWHYRYIGPEAVQFQNKWFSGIQQYMLVFIAVWKKS